MEQAKNPNHFTIPVTAWGEFLAKLAKLNKRAAKLGCEKITFEVIAEGETERSHTFKTHDGEYTKHYKVKTKTIELTGKAPKLEGFQFVAKIEYLSDNKSVLFHSVPGSEIKIDDRFRTLRPSTCEHCNKVRRRAETFVVLNVETGKQTQVGRQCLADFTGINSPQALAAKASWLSSFSDLQEESERWWDGSMQPSLTVRGSSGRPATVSATVNRHFSHLTSIRPHRGGRVRKIDETRQARTL